MSWLTEQLSLLNEFLSSDFRRLVRRCALGMLLAALLLTLAHYYIAAFLFGRPHSRRTVVLALMGAVFGLTSLADRPSIFTSMAVLAYSMSALTFARALLRGMYGPNRPERMPPPAEDMENDI